MPDEMENQNDSQDVESPECICVNCKKAPPEHGYITPLCIDCRDALSKRFVPAWIKAVASVITIVFIFALTRFPVTIDAAIAFERGKNAEKASMYRTAVREYEKAIERFPDSTQIITRLYAAYWRNNDISKATEIFDNRIVGRETENRAQFDEINKIANRISFLYFGTEEFTKILESCNNATPEKTIETLRPYVEKHPGETIPKYCLASSLYDVKNYDEVEKLMVKTIIDNPDFDSGSLLLAAVYREKDEFEKCISYCNRILQRNLEDSSAYASMARTELKRHQDKTGLDLAVKAYQLASEDTYTIATLAIAYHYNNMIKERGEMLALFKQCKDAAGYKIDFWQSVFDGQTEWRD
ncbi:MAG: hypothetical protein HZA48_11455 [Planctomycetes bacterium]|nr:hypothetical protein [Planctomycetota bacterium]